MLTKTNNKKINLLIIFFIFICSYLIYYWGINNGQNAYNSDYSYYAIAGKDIFSGNILLKGWYGATNSFYLLDVIYGIFGIFLGYKVSLVYVVSAVIWALTISVIAYVTLNKHKDKYSEKYFNLIIVLALCYSACYLTQDIRILGGAHLDTFLLSFIYIWTISNEKIVINKKKDLVKFIAASLCLIIAIVSDELVVYFTVLPITVTFLIRIIFKKEEFKAKKQYELSIIITVIDVVLAKVLMKVIVALGGIQLTWKSTYIQFVERENIFNRIEYYIEMILYLFNADVFGKAININNFSSFLHLLLFLTFLLCLCFCIRGIYNQSIFNQIMIWIIIIQSCILIFTDYIKTTDSIGYTSRIMYYCWFAMIILLVQIDFKRIYDISKITLSLKWARMLGVFLCFAVLVISVSTIEHTVVPTENNKIQKVVDILKERNLKQGYGTFWLANVTTLASNCEIYVNPVCNSSDLSKFQWLSFSTKRWDYADFVLVDDSRWDDVTRDSIVDSIGEPDEEIHVDNVIVMIWSKNIMPYIDNSGATEDIDYWWNLSEGEVSKHIETTNKHFSSAFEANEEGYYVSRAEGQLLYGPFRTLEEGIYNITFEYDYSGELHADENIGYVDVFSYSGNIDYSKEEMVVGENSVVLQNVAVGPNCTDAEFRSYAYTSDLSIKRVIIEKIK